MRLEQKQKNYTKRQLHVRKHILGTAQRPRVAVFRSNSHIQAQIINDELGLTLAAATDNNLKSKKPIEKATEVGKDLGEIAKKNSITKVVFDRRGYKYHGRVKALADGLRSAGVEF